MSIWGSALKLGGSLLGGFASGKASAANDRANKTESRYASRQDALYQGILSQFNSELDYMNEQRARANKQRGLAEFRKFNNVSAYAPNYQQDYQGIVVPNAPDINQMLPGVEQAPKVSTSGGLLSKLMGAII